MARMYDPAHPGEVLREFLGDLTVTAAADKLGVTRVTLSRILNCNKRISADMALRLEAAFGRSAESWLMMQANRDIWVASQQPRPKIPRIRA